MPAAVARKLSEQIVAASANAAVQETVASWGAEVPPADPAHLAETVRVEKALWSKLAREKHIVDVD